jgi:hypothetical protein
MRRNRATSSGGAVYLPLRASRRPSSVNEALRSSGLPPTLENDPSALNRPGNGRRCLSRPAEPL